MGSVGDIGFQINGCPKSGANEGEQIQHLSKRGGQPTLTDSKLTLTYSHGLDIFSLSFKSTLGLRLLHNNLVVGAFGAGNLKM